MIRVNLLPVEKRRAPRVKVKVKREIPFMTIIIALLLAAIVSLLCGYWYLMMQRQIEKVREDAEVERQMIAQLNITIQEVEALEGQIAELKQKIQIIENLQKAQAGPVLMMDELAKSLPQRVWLESFTENGTSIEIEGVGANNLVVAAFMENLERSPKFRSVELTASTTGQRPGYGSEKLKVFLLSALIEEM